MHTFQPYPIDKMEFNPFTKIGKEWALVSAGDKTKCNTMTVSWGGVGVLWGKNVVFIFIRDSRYTKEFLDSHSGRGEEDKFASAGLTKAFRHDIPYPDEANLVFLCRKMAAVPISEDSFTDSTLMDKWYSDHDMHMMYVGEIVEVTAR